MRKAHILKTDSDVMKALRVGIKKFEIRKDDRSFELGDYLILRETRFSGAEMANGSPLVYIKRPLVLRVSYIMGIEAKFGQKVGPCAVMSVELVASDYDEDYHEVQFLEVLSDGSICDHHISFLSPDKSTLPLS